MKVTKLSISLDPDLAAEVRDAAKRSEKSLSAWIAEAVQAQLRHQNLGELLDEWQAEHGAFTQEELDRADEELGFTPPAQQQRRAS